jgi:hypothetical protein
MSLGVRVYQNACCMAHTTSPGQPTLSYETRSSWEVTAQPTALLIWFPGGVTSAAITWSAAAVACSAVERPIRAARGAETQAETSFAAPDPAV